MERSSGELNIQIAIRKEGIQEAHM